MAIVGGATARYNKENGRIIPFWCWSKIDDDSWLTLFYNFLGHISDFFPGGDFSKKGSHDLESSSKRHGGTDAPWPSLVIFVGRSRRHTERR